MDFFLNLSPPKLAWPIWIGRRQEAHQKYGTYQLDDRLLGWSASNYMDVSENSGTPKSSILVGFSIINHPFWGTLIFGNTHIRELVEWWDDGFWNTFPVAYVFMPISKKICWVKRAVWIEYPTKILEDLMFLLIFHGGITWWLNFETLWLRVESDVFGFGWQIRIEKKGMLLGSKLRNIPSSTSKWCIDRIEHIFCSCNADEMYSCGDAWTAQGTKSAYYTF